MTDSTSRRIRRIACASFAYVFVVSIALTQAFASQTAGKEPAAVVNDTAATADPIARARDASERARRLKAAGDNANAALAEELANQWSKVATDLARAIEMERLAEKTRRNALEASARIERERALVDETTAQTGRLRAQLDSIKKESRTSPERTAPNAANDDVARAETSTPKAQKQPSPSRQAPKDAGPP